MEKKIKISKNREKTTKNILKTRKTSKNWEKSVKNNGKT